ncbi:MAG: pyridoxamine 5'-phosphate oxidase family protein [Candidatus Nanohaloarchaea archaeon]
MELEVEEDYGKERFEDSISNILQENRLCTLATVSPDSEAHAATAFYAFDDELNLYILTPPETEHGQHLEKNSSIALSIYDSHQQFSSEKQGLQFFGTAEKAEPEEALEIYRERFPDVEQFASEPGDVKELDSCFYRIEPERFKLFDEPEFGTETWVNIRLKN